MLTGTVISEKSQWNFINNLLHFKPPFIELKKYFSAEISVSDRNMVILSLTYLLCVSKFKNALTIWGNKTMDSEIPSMTSLPKFSVPFLL